MRSPSGASAALVRLARRGRVQLVANVAIVLEYEAICQNLEHRAAAGLTPQETDMFLDGLAAMMEPVETHFMWRPQLRDPSDEMVLEAAVNGSATIVTFNRKDFAGAAERFGVEVSPPGDIMRRITR